MSRQRSRQMLVIGAIIAVLGSASLFSDSRASPAGSPEIRLGIVVPLTGAVRSFGIEARNGVLMAVSEWNARGGVNGARIKSVKVIAYPRPRVFFPKTLTRISAMRFPRPVFS